MILYSKRKNIQYPKKDKILYSITKKILYSIGKYTVLKSNSKSPNHKISRGE